MNTVCRYGVPFDPTPLPPLPAPEPRPELIAEGAEEHGRLSPQGRRYATNVLGKVVVRELISVKEAIAKALEARLDTLRTEIESLREIQDSAP